MSTRLVIAALLLSMLASIEPVYAAGAPGVTASGIPLDAPWKVRIYELAHSKFLHPGWGWQHSERDYLMATRLARGDACTSTPTCCLPRLICTTCRRSCPVPGRK